MDNYIEIRNVGLAHQTKYQRVEIFKNLNLSIAKNEFVVVFGASGTGKSTLLNIIAGFVTPNSGQVLVNGNNILEYGESQICTYRNKCIGYIFQAFNLIYQFNVRENIKVPLLISNASGTDKRERTDFLLAKMGMAHRANHYPNELSGGEQQRVAIARALANRPNIILADEPTGNLDKKNGSEVIELISGIHKDGNTVIVVTHDESILCKADRVIMIEDYIDGGSN